MGNINALLVVGFELPSTIVNAVLAKLLADSTGP